MENENQTTVTWTPNLNEEQWFLSKIKWFFQKSDKVQKGQNRGRLTKAFHFTRKDSIISTLVALVVVWGAIYYWKVVLDEYASINDRAEELRYLSSYDDANIDKEKVSSYTDWSENSTIEDLILLNNNIQKSIEEDNARKQQQKKYYETLLQNIYLPSLNTWKDPYTKNFNMAVLGQKYLETDKFQDLYLIQYWSDFVKYVWNDADYNEIDQVTIWDKTVLEWNPAYFYIPVTISFSSPNKRSFLLLVNKLSTTSNQNNIALLNEFFSHLLEIIKKDKTEEIEQLMQEYREDFTSSSNRKFSKNFWELSEEERSIYRDRVVWYNLYHWINGDSTTKNATQLINDDIIVKVIKDSASCENVTEQTCFYNFREKYRNLPYLAYKIWMENQDNRTKWLLEFLQDLPPAIAITNFWFEKYSNSSFLNNEEEKYEWRVSFNAYGRNILDPELEEASKMLWKLCFWNTSTNEISPEFAIEHIEKTMSTSDWWDLKYSNISSLLELQWLLTSIQKSYNGMSNYDKMIKLFEIWRMMNDANLCNK